MTATMALNWLATEAGRKFTRTAVGVLGGAGFGAFLLPHTYFLDKTKEIVQMYKNGAPVPLDNKIKARADEVLQELTYMLDREKNSITFFTVYGPDVFHKGSTQLRSGAIIGLPVNYNYEHPNHVEKNQLQLGRHPNFNWHSDIGQKLIEALILQPHAQKFAIAREIAYSNTNYVYTNAAVAVSSFLTAYVTGSFINRSLHLYEKARKQRLILYGMLGALGGVVYLILTDALSLHYDRFVDGKVANLGKEYIMGGVEYYEKVLDRNKAIRRALGSTGESWYTAQGNENEWIRVRHMPLTARLDYLKSRLREFERKKPDPSPSPSKIGDRLSASRSSQLDYMAKGVTPGTSHPVPPLQSTSPMHSGPMHSSPVRSSPSSNSISSSPLHSMPLHPVSPTHTAPTHEGSALGPKGTQKQPHVPSGDGLKQQTTQSQLGIHPQDSSHVCKFHQKHSLGMPAFPGADKTPPSIQTLSPQHSTKQPLSPTSPGSPGNQPTRSYSPHIQPPIAVTQNTPTLTHQSPASIATPTTTLVHQSSSSLPRPPTPMHQTSTTGLQVPSPVPQPSNPATQQPQVKLTGSQLFSQNPPVVVDGMGISYNVGLPPREAHEKVQVEASTPSVIPELFRATFNNLWQILTNL